MQAESSTQTLKIPPNGRTPEQNVWRAEVTRALFDANMPAAADAFARCQDESSVRFYVVCEADAEHQATALAHTCHLRICPECEARNSARLLARYLEPIRDVYAAAPSSYRLRHIVLTTSISLLDSDVRGQLRRSYDTLGAFFDELWGDDWQQTGCGYLAGAEFGPNGLKLHFHVLVLCDWIDQNRARDIWTRLTGFTALPYIRAVSAANYPLENALTEIIKYTTKLSELKPDLMPTLLDAIYRTRRIRARGAFYRLPQPEPERSKCKECGSRLVLWSRSKFENWQRGAIGRALSDFDGDALSELLLRLGNKSSGISPSEVPKSLEVSDDGDDWPPPRDLESMVPPTWINEQDEAPIMV